MQNPFRFFKFFSLLLLTVPFFVGVVFLAIPVVPGCPINLFAYEDALLVVGGLILIFWIFGILWIVWYKKNSIKISETPKFQFKMKIVIGLFLTILLFGAAMSYASYELGMKISSLSDKQKYLSNNTANVVYESDDYNAFPRLIELQNGSLWTVWYQGDWHIDSHNDGKLLQSFSHDNGSTWQTPQIIADDSTYDTRNPAIGQLADGTLVLMIFEYDGTTRKAIRSEWSLSKDGGLSWSTPQEINSTQYNPTSEPNRLSWISPFGNLFLMNGHYVAAFYGGNGIIDELQDQIALLEYQPALDRWNYYATPMGDSVRGYNEADIEWVGDRWLCVSRTSENIMYYANSSNGINWSTPKNTGLDKGHSPELVVLKQNTSEWQMFCCYRAEKGFLRGGYTTYNPATDIFWCEDQILYTAEGEGGADTAYASAIRFNESTVGFVNYDVIMCCDNGCDGGTHGKILWQIWEN